MVEKFAILHPFALPKIVMRHSTCKDLKCLYSILPLLAVACTLTDIFIINYVDYDTIINTSPFNASRLTS